jgi:hypothetical protein
VEENNIRNLPCLCFDTLQNQGFSKTSQIVTVHNPKKTNRERKREQEKLWKPFSPGLNSEYIQRRSQISRASDSEWYPATNREEKDNKNSCTSSNWPLNF